MKTILIGATGATGKELLKILLKDESVTEVVALVRRALNIQHKKLQSIVVDFNKPELWLEYVKGDAAFSCMGTTLKTAGSKKAQYKVDYEYQYAFAAAASKNGIPKFLLISASTANSRSVVFYSRIKGELEQAVKLLTFEKLVIFRPGLLSRFDAARRSEKLGEKTLKFFNRFGLFKNMSPLPVDQLAELMLYYAKLPEKGEVTVGPGKILEQLNRLKTT